MSSFASSSYRWVIAGVLFPLHLAIGLNVLAPSPLFPVIMEDYSLSRGTVSLLVASVGVALTLFLIPSGIMVAKFGPKKAAAIAGFLMAAGILAALTPPFWVLVTLRVAFGLGVAIILPATSAAVLQWFTPQERPFMNGLNLAGQGLGIAAAMFLSVPIAERLGWQYPLFLYGAFALLGAVTWLLLGRSPAPGTSSISPPPIREVLLVIKDKNTLLLSLSAVGPFGLFIGYSSWLPSYYHEVLAMPLDQAGSLVAILPLMAGLFNLFGGVVLTWLGLRKPLFILSGVLFPLLAFGTFFFDNLVLITGSLVLLGLTFSLFVTTLFTIPMELPGISLQKVAVVTAAALTFGNLASVFSPMLLGIATDALGSYKPGLLIVAFIPVTVLVAAAFLPETGPKGTRHEIVPANQRPI